MKPTHLTHKQNDNQSDKPWIEDDKQWFMNHPERRYRMREAWPEEREAYARKMGIELKPPPAAPNGHRITDMVLVQHIHGYKHRAFAFLSNVPDVSPDLTWESDESICSFFEAIGQPQFLISPFRGDPTGKH